MLKPSDVSPIAQSTPSALEIEHQCNLFDRAIQQAEFSGQWPAIVSAQRDGATISLIQATITRYRAAGWLVSEGRGDVRATIDHPDRQAEGTGQAMPGTAMVTRG